MGHNSKHGCSKDTVEGQYNHISKTTVFTKLDAPKRTDEFRNKVYFGGHQKVLSPVLEIPKLDMIQDFPIGDSMHLLDHGITNKLLNGFISGKLNNADAKWSSHQTLLISKYLLSIKAPAEIRAQRQIRDLTSIAKWKAIEYRNFALYLGIVILNGNLEDYIYKHFLLYFCALTIITSKHHMRRLSRVADLCLKLFVERFKIIYGDHHFTSNVHNLIHLMDDVKRFEPTNTFSTYPFESQLYRIKRLLRTGNLNPKALLYIQSEYKNDPINDYQLTLIKFSSTLQLDHLNQIYSLKYDLYSIVEFPKFKIDCNRDEDRWILTKQKQIIEISCFVSCDGTSRIYGQSLIDIEDYFTLPIKSSEMSIYCSKKLKKKSPELFNVFDVKCKMFKIKLDHEYVFLHDNEDDEDNYVFNDCYVFFPIHGTFID